jgi:predicted phage tail protein
MNIRGAGGGKSGGGSARVAVEAPDSLQSVQYAKVLDLISEGEIGGLVNGLQSILIDSTPLMNENGQYNFSGVTVDYRLGTQGQNYIAGFPAIENEVPVGAEVKAALPITRTITNENINAARLTLSVPSLTSQNTSNGDVSGTTVTFRVDYQNNGGGFIPVRVGVEGINLSVSGLTASSGDVGILSASIGINWTGLTSKTDGSGYWWSGDTYNAPAQLIQQASWIAQYRALPSGTWTQFGSGSFSDTARTEVVWNGDSTTTNQIAPTGSASASVSLTEGPYEFRVIPSGDGSMGLSYANGQYWTPNIHISGKTTSRYQRSFRLELPSPGPWDIRVSRVTADSTSQALQNKTFWDSYTEVIDAKLCYPNSAVFGLEIDARQFTSIPSRAYDIRGIKVKVPTNYDPITRVYAGEWDGDFQIAWTDNPTWIFYDLVANTRYGLGEFIDADSIDKWGLYSIAQYCDEIVPTGSGGSEPRFTCNAFIQTRSEAYTLLTQMASVFRAMTFWSSEQITCVQDRPSDPVALFTSANVIDGVFNYSGSSVKARHTVALVTWNDPADRYRQKVEYVEDQDGIERYGVVQTEVNAFGCTSRGQAHRVGRWILYSERMETETITFKAGMDAALIYPGAVINTQDQFRSGERFGGRIMSATVSEVTIDAPITVEAGKTYELSVVLPDGSIETRAVTNLPGNHTVMALGAALTAAPQDFAMWVMSASDLVPEEWRVVSMSESEPGVIEISALASRQDKYAAIEQDLVLEPISTTSINGGADAVENLVIGESLYLVTSSIVGNAVTLSWTGNSPRYIVSYNADGVNPQPIDVAESSYTYKDILPGVYTFSVQAVNALGRRGVAAVRTKEIYGLSAPPVDVTGFSLAAIAGAAHIAFNPSPDLDVIVSGHLRLRHSKTGSSWNDAIDIGVFVAGSATSAVVPLLQGTYFAKWVDGSGIESINATMITTNAPSIIALNFVESVIEHPDFAGAKSNVGIDEFVGDPCLTLDSQLTIDEIGLIDDQPGFMAWGGVAQSGQYLFADSVDLGAVYTSRLTADLQTFGYNPNDTVDTWGMLDALQSIEGDVINDVSARVMVRTSDDAVTYGAWEPLVVGDYSARAFDFRLDLSSSGSNNIAVTQCAVSVDMPDTVQSAEDIVSGAGAYTVTYPHAYFANPAIGITAQDMTSGDYYEITGKSNTGFAIIFKNQSGTAISRTFDYIAKGY